MADIASFGVGFDTTGVKQGADDVDAAMSRVAQAAARGAASLQSIPAALDAHAEAAKAATDASTTLTSSLGDVQSATQDVTDAANDAAEAVAQQADAHVKAAGGADVETAAMDRLGRAFSDNEMRSGRLKFMMENVLLSMSGLSGMGVHLAATFGIIAAGVETAMVALAGIAAMTAIVKSGSTAYDALGTDIDKETKSVLSAADAHQSATTSLALMQQGVQRADEEVAKGPAVWAALWKGAKDFFDLSSDAHAILGPLNTAIAEHELALENDQKAAEARAAVAEASTKRDLDGAAAMATTTGALKELQAGTSLNAGQMKLASEQYYLALSTIEKFADAVVHGADDVKIMDDAIKAARAGWEVLNHAALESIDTLDVTLKQQRDLTNAQNLLTAAQTGGLAAYKRQQDAQKDQSTALATAGQEWDAYKKDLVGADGVIGDSIDAHSSLSVAIYNTNAQAKAYMASATGMAAATRIATEAAQEFSNLETLRTAADQQSLKTQADLLRASGDDVGALQKEGAATQAVIKAKYDKLEADNLAMEALNSSVTKMFEQQRADESLAAQTATGTAIFDARHKTLMDLTALATTYNDSVRETAIKEASLTDATKAQNLTYADRAAKLQETYDKTVLTITGTHGLTSEVMAGELAFAAAALAVGQHQLALDKDIDTAKAGVEATKALNDSQSALTIAMLKASGDTVGAARAEADARSAATIAVLEEAMATKGLSDAQKAQYQQAIDNWKQEAVLMEQADALAKKHTGTVADLYTTLGEDMNRTMRKAFEDMFSGGLDAWKTFFTDIEKMFEKMLGDMAASEAESALGKNLFGKLQGGPQVTQPSTTAYSGTNDVTADASNGGSAALASTLTASSVLGGAIGVGAIGLISSAIGSIIGGFTNDAAAAAAAAAKIKDAQDSFATSLKSWVDSMEGAAAASAADAAAAAKLSQQQGALTAASATGGVLSGYTISSGQSLFVTPQQLEADTNDELEALRKLLKANGDLTPAYNTLINQLEVINTAAADDGAMLKSVAAAYTASIPVYGSQLKAINDAVDAYNTSTAALSQVADATARSTAAGQLASTELNTIETVLDGMTAAALDALIASGQLTGTLLSMAQAADQAKHEAEDLADTQRNNTAIGALDARIGTADATVDPAEAQAYDALARAQTEHDELLKAETQLSTDLAAAAGPAVIAQDNYIISLTQTAQAAEDAATKLKVAHDQAVAQATAQEALATAAGNTALAQSYADVLESIKETDDYNAALAAGYDQTTASMVQAADAATYLAAKLQAVTDFQNTVASEYNTSLGLSNLNTIQGYVTQYTKDWSQAVADGLTTSLGPIISATLTNNESQFLAGLSIPDLVKLIPSLTGNVLDLANSFLTLDQATQDATESNALAIRDMTAQGDSAGATMAQLYSDQQTELQDAYAKGFSPSVIQQLIKTQEDEWNKAIADQQAAQATAAASATSASTTAATAATASPTSFDMAVGTTESTSNRIAGLLQSQLDYQINLTYLPMILTQLQALTGRTHTPAELDVIGASASAAGNRAAGNPPRNQ